MGEFKLPPYSSLVGSEWVNFYRIVKDHKIDPDKYYKLFITQLIIMGSTPFHVWEKICDSVVNTKIEFQQPPVFILGHWRSGTTYLHNLLCQDRNSSYLTTYHSVFPNNLSSKFIYKNIMRKKLPETRPGDSVKLNVDYPQEDEFALSNTIPYNFYNFFYFPQDYQLYYDRYVRFLNVDSKIRSQWKKSYEKLLAKAIKNTGGKRIIVKNPVNTARVKILLEIFPEAKFIHIYRNPVEVYLSTKKFFLELFPSIWLKSVSKEFILDMILDIYTRIYSDYFAQRDLIPEGNLYELSFEELEKEPLYQLEQIYNRLNLGDYSDRKNQFILYLKETRNYKKNKYRISEEELMKIINKWGEISEKLGYKNLNPLEE